MAGLCLNSLKKKKKCGLARAVLVNVFITKGKLKSLAFKKIEKSLKERRFHVFYSIEKYRTSFYSTLLKYCGGIISVFFFHGKYQ